MESRLAVCSQYLKEAETKLNELHTAIIDDPVAKSKIIEALSFIHQARKAISETLARVETLQQ